MPSSCAVRDHLDPVRGGQLALGQHPAHVVVEDLGGRAGQRAHAGLPRPQQPLAQRQAGAGDAVHHLHRRERVHVHAGAAALDLGRDVEVRGARQVGVDAALHADLGRARGPRLLGALADLVERQRVGVGVGAALRERAEPAAGVADVGEVDVPRDDERHVVAVDLAAQAVGDRRQRVQVGAVGGRAGRSPASSVSAAGSRSAWRRAAATSPGRATAGAGAAPARPACVRRTAPDRPNGAVPPSASSWPAGLRSQPRTFRHFSQSP